MKRIRSYHTRRQQRGFAIGGVIAGIALLAVFAGASYTIFGNSMGVMNRMTREDHNFNLVRTSLRVLNTQLSDTDTDGAVEMPAWLVGAGPSDGGVLPTTFPGQRSDAWGSLFGYCTWDHGTTNVSTGRIAGTAAAYEALPIVALISPGPNRTFQTTCADAYAGTTRGDDLMMRSTVTEASTGSTGGGDLWTEEATSIISYGATTPNANRVGIGTSTPQSTFTVNAPTQQQGIQLQTGATTIARLRGQTASNDEGELVLYRAGTENVRLSTGALPQLHLGDWLRAQAVGNQSMFGWNVFHNGTSWVRANADGGAAIRMHGVDAIFGAGGGGISFHVNPDGAAGSVATQMDGTDIKMGINASGVGIRLTNPSAPLTIRQQNDSQNGGNAGLRIEKSDGSVITQLLTGGDNSSYLFNGTGNSYIALNSSGNVGIGLAPTGYKLTAQGDIYAANGWIRTAGASTGWYHEGYGGGWYMQDASWIRSLNRPVYMAAGFDTSSGATSGIGCNGGAGYAGYSLHVCGYSAFDQTWAPNFHNAASYLISGACWSGACASDIRLKDHVRPFELGLDALLNIDLVYYRFNGLGGMDKTEKDGIGVIAQQVEEKVPQLIKTKMVKMHKGDAGETEIKQVDYTALPWLTMNAVKELNAKVDAQAALIQRQSTLIAEQQSALASLKEELRTLRQPVRLLRADTLQQTR